MIVVADATPLRYLILIEAVDILPVLYERILIPHIVADENAALLVLDGLKVIRDGLCGNPYIFERERIRDDGSPAIRSKLDW